MKFCVYLIISLNLLLVSLPANALSIAMVVWRGQTDAEISFLESLEDMGFETEITLINAEQDKAKLGRIIRKDLTNNLHKFDYVYSFGTTATKAVKTHLDGKRPHIFNIVSYPADAEILPSEQGGQKNTAGVSSRVPIELQIINARKLIAMDKVAVAFNPREANSTRQLEKMTELAKAHQFEVVPLRIRPNQSLFMADLKQLDKHLPVSAVYLPSDSFLISNSKEILTYINESKIPSICAVSTYIKNGCLTGTVANYQTLGKLAASIVKAHQNGVALADMAVKYDTEAVLTINHKTRTMLNLDNIEQAEK